jgi:hypothetical protein
MEFGMFIAGSIEAEYAAVCRSLDETRTGVFESAAEVLHPSDKLVQAYVPAFWTSNSVALADSVVKPRSEARRGSLS